MLEERDFELKLVNSRHVKIVPGRKSDVLDAEWLAELLEHGLLRSSFVPPVAIRQLRDLTRYRKRLVQAQASEGQRIEKTLEDAGIKLDSVVSQLLGVSGRAMLYAPIAGERNPERLAELAKGRLRGKIPELRRALHGRFSEHHALLVRLSLEHIEHLEAAETELDARIDLLFATNTSEGGVPFVQARDRLATITGVGKRAAETIIAEIGVDMTRFPTPAHLSSWAGVAPGTNITGGKRRSGRTNHGNVWLRDVLCECAWAAARSHDTYLSTQYWRLAAPHRQTPSRDGRRALHPGHLLAPPPQRHQLPRPRRRLLRTTHHRPRPPTQPSHPPTHQPRLPRHPRQRGLTGQRRFTSQAQQ